jgi:invasion protein IalB
MLMVAFILLFVGTGNALAQQQQQKAKQVAPQQDASKAGPATASPGWRLLCDGAVQSLDCRVSQTLLVKQTGQLLLSVVVRKPSKTEPPALMLHLPHGLNLPAGVMFHIGKAQPQPLAVQTCDEKGCYAGMALSVEMLTSMQKSEELFVHFQGLDKRPISISMPLAGFADAFRKIP